MKRSKGRSSSRRSQSNSCSLGVLVKVVIFFCSAVGIGVFAGLSIYLHFHSNDDLVSTPVPGGNQVTQDPASTVQSTQQAMSKPSTSLRGGDDVGGRGAPDPQSPPVASAAAPPAPAPVTEQAAGRATPAPTAKSDSQSPPVASAAAPPAPAAPVTEQEAAPATPAPTAKSEKGPELLAQVPARDEPIIGPRLVNTILRDMDMRSDDIWNRLLDSHPDPRNAIVIEVGAADCVQATAAAEKGFITYTFEPSPHNVVECKKVMKEKNAPSNLHLVEAAATNETGTLQFVSIPWDENTNKGAHTGNHVRMGHHPEQDTNQAFKRAHEKSSVDVPAVRLDDKIGEFLSKHGAKSIYIVKIDVQGHEYPVLQGLAQALKKGLVDYVICEFWPRAIENTTGVRADAILELLHKNGFLLMDSGVYTLGRKPPPLAQQLQRPTAFAELGEWFLQMDKAAGDKFGCWTDIIASRSHKSTSIVT